MLLAASVRLRMPVAAGLVVLSSMTSAVHGELGINEELRQALQRNASALSPLTVAWERKRTSQLGEEKLLSILGLPDTAREFMAPERVRFMWQDGMFYAYYWRHMPQVTPTGEFLLNAPLVVVEQEISFDRRAYYSGNPNRRGDQKIADPLIIIDPLEKLIKEGSKGTLCIASYLYEAGFVMPQSAEELTSRQPQTLVLSQLDDGAELTRVDTEDVGVVSCVVVESRNAGQRNRFTLDPSKDYAMRRRMAWYPSGDLEVKIDCLDFVRLDSPEHWLPRRIEIERFHRHTGSEEPLIREVLSVTELHNKPIPPEQFVLFYREPGTVVADGTLPGAQTRNSGRITYTVPANPEHLDEVIREATEGPRTSTFTKWLVAVNLVLAAAVGSFFIWRRLASRGR